MDSKEILDGLKYRIARLEETMSLLIKEGQLHHIDDYTARIDELDSVHKWIKENSEEDK